LGAPSMRNATVLERDLARGSKLNRNTALRAE
jgi:hypothetical protein